MRAKEGSMVIYVTVMAAEFGDYARRRVSMETCHESALSWYRVRDWNGYRHSSICHRE
jgi:hypothetical protein